MKLIKIFIWSILILSVLFNVVSATYYNGTIEKDIISQNSYGPRSAQDGYETIGSYPLIFYYDGYTNDGYIDKLIITNVVAGLVLDWNNIPTYVGSEFTLSGTDIQGNFYIRKTSSEGKVDICLFFYEDSDFYNLSASDYTVNINSWNSITFYYSGTHCKDYTDGGGNYLRWYNTINTRDRYYASISGVDSYYVIDTKGQFKNTYSIELEGLLGQSSIDRTHTSYITTSTFIIKNENEDTIYSHGPVTTDNLYDHGNYSYSYWLKLAVDDSEYLLLDSTPYTPPDPEDTLPTLTSDKTMYNYMDEITFNYTNLDNIDDEIDSYDLITYCIDNLGNYKSLGGLHLNYGYDKYDGPAWLATDGYPYGDIYYGVIDNSLNYKNNKNIIMSNVYLSDTIFIIPQLGNPYISITDKSDYYNNGNTIYYSYYTKLESNITIEDYNNEVIIKILYVNGTGIGEYTLPYDDNKNYEYPIWSINMSSYNDTYTVYWMEQDVIPYNPDYTPEVDPEIQESIDDIKDELEPLKDLIFGLSTIFLDNPDYDSNGIVDTEELSNWFNSIVMIIIVLTIYIFYKGLRRK